MGITFIFGDVFIKRQHFLTKQLSTINIDNDELLGVIKDKNCLYFLQGQIPYGNMTIYEYVCYNQSYLHSRPMCEREINYIFSLFRVYYPRYKKMSSLSICEYKLVQIIANWSIDTKKIIINLDGLGYSRQNERDLKRLIGKLKNYDLVIGVSDLRFVCNKGNICYYDEIDNKIIGLTFYSCSKINKHCVKNIISKKDITFSYKDIENVNACLMN